MEPLHTELRKIRIKMGWAVRGHKKIKTRVVSWVRLARKKAGTFIECGQYSSFLHLKKM
jgi:hypothetical protein